MRAAILLSLTILLTGLANPAACRRADSRSQGASGKQTPPAQRAEEANIPVEGDPFATIPRIKVEELVQAIKENRVVVVDVSVAEAYVEEHIKGAVSIPLEEVRERGPKELPPDKLIVTYCACAAEHSSAQAASFLRYKGFKQTAALLGGLDAWKAAGLPVEP